MHIENLAPCFTDCHALIFQEFMYNFEKPIKLGADPRTDLPVFGFAINHMFIHDPYISECGRFDVDPQQVYGISKEDAQNLKNLNQLVEDATQAALNAGCMAIQTAMGVMSGDVAGVHFSGPEQTAPVALAMAEYMLSELNLAPESPPQPKPRGM